MDVPTQITLDGREEPIAAPLAPRPCHEAPGLFDPAPFAQQNGQLAADLGPLDCDLRPDLESAGAWDDDYLRSIL